MCGDGGEHVIPGNISARQRGPTWHPGLNGGMGTDHTLFAKIEGHVVFRAKADGRTFVSVLPMTDAADEERADKKGGRLVLLNQRNSKRSAKAVAGKQAPDLILRFCFYGREARTDARIPNPG